MAGLQGKTLGGFLLADRIATSGIAEVYRARPTAGGRDVVVKVIYPEFARQPGFLPNFRGIVQTAAQLANHAHILPVVASGEEQGYLYLATPYVEAGTLRDWLQRGGRLGVSDAGPFFRQLCGAVTYAHNLGIVHGNLKPSNVFLFEGRHVLLGDFGILWDVQYLDLNHSGSGTDAVELLAPEAFRGHSTQASDIYSLGVLLFLTIAGAAPFRANKPADLLAAHTQLPVPSLHQIAPGLPPALAPLDAVIQQAMAKRPEDRFPSAMALAQAVETVMQQARAAMPPAAPAQPAIPPVFTVPAFAGGDLAPAPGAAPVAPVHLPFPPLGAGSALDAAMDQPHLPSPEPSQYTERVPAPAAGEAGHAGEYGGPAASIHTEVVPAPGRIEALSAQRPPYQDEPVDEWGGQRMPAINLRGGVAGDVAPLGDDRYDVGRHLAGAPRWDGYESPAMDTYQQQQNLAIQVSHYPAQDASGGSWQNPSHDYSLGGVAEQSRHPSHSSSANFSPTELGLPRLTSPALRGELPAEWEELLADERLPHRDDFAGGYTGPYSAQRPAVESRHTGGHAGTYGGRDDDAFAADDSFLLQRVWTVGATAVRRPRRRWVRTTVLLLLVPLLLSGAGIVVARPELCPISACASASAFVRTHVPLPGATSAPSRLDVPASPIKLAVTAGGSGTATLRITNRGDTADWQAASSLPWLTVGPESGTTAAGSTTSLTITAKPVGVNPGTYPATITIGTASQTVSVPVEVTVGAGPEIKAAPTTLTFNTCGVAQNFTVRNSGGGTLNFTASPSATEALTLGSSSGSLAPGGTSTVTVTVTCGAESGSYAVILVSNGGSTKVTIQYLPQ